MSHQTRPEWVLDDLADTSEVWPVTDRRNLYDARVFTYRQDRIITPDGDPLVRSYLHHPGAVAILAITDDDRVAVLRQYRHPAGLRMVELPAGLLDVAGEDPLAAARRELAEEAMLAADTWHTLVDVCGSPGSSQESLRVYWATGLAPAERPDGFVVEHEEAHMDLGWAHLGDLTAAVLAGRVHNPGVVAGTLALAAIRAQGAAPRPADAPWPSRAAKAHQDDAR